MQLENHTSKMPVTERILAASLIGLIVSLLLIGVVSATIVRHTIQVIPAALALAAVARRRAWAAYAAFPVFLFWFLIILAIWLFLLGLANVVTGNFTTAEVALTVLTAVSSVCGMVITIRSRPAAGFLGRLVALALFAALQVGAMWISLQPMFATR